MTIYNKFKHFDFNNRPAFDYNGLQKCITNSIVFHVEDLINTDPVSIHIANWLGDLPIKD